MVSRFFSFVVVTLVVIFGLGQGAAQAHGPNQSYVYFHVTETELSGRFETSSKVLLELMDLDTNGDGALDEGEMRAQSDAIFERLNSDLVIKHEGTVYDVVPTDVLFLTTQFDTFIWLNFDIPDLTPVPEEIEMTYTFNYKDDPTHLAYALIASNERTGLVDNEGQIALVFSEGNETQTLSLVGKPLLELLQIFIVQGVWHIWLGYDHVLFLVSLLITSVLVIYSNRWEPADDLGSAGWEVLKLVTAFTIAHSITLSLAALKIVEMPSGFIEAVIAASIAYVALGNLFPQLHKWPFVAVIVFGLFHGFGFANVLEPINIEPNQKLITLFGFNLGVEIGQVAIVLVVFPIFYLLRESAFYDFVIRRIGSIMLIVISIYWFEQRTSGMVPPLGPMVRSWLGMGA